MTRASKDISAPAAKPQSRLRRWGKKLLALVISTFIALVLAEVVVRFAAPQVLSVPLLESFGGLQVTRANLDGRAQVPGLFSVTYHTNSQRFRGRQDYSERPAPGVPRIVATGDSFCFGLGAEDDQAYPAVLEKLMSAGGRRVEVINAGVGGTGTGSQALWYELALARFKPNVVVLAVFVNDLDDDLASPMFTLDGSGNAVPVPLAERERRMEPVERARKRVNAIPGYSFLAEHSHLVNMVRRIASISMSGGGAKAPVKSAEQVAKERARYTSEAPPLLKAELRWLNEKVRANGGTLVVAWFPTRETIYPDAGAEADDGRWKSGVAVEALTQFAAAEGVPLLEPTAAFLAKAKVTEGELFYKGADNHARPAGYQLFAEEVAGFLKKLGLPANGR